MGGVLAPPPTPISQIHPSFEKSLIFEGLSLVFLVPSLPNLPPSPPFPAGRNLGDGGGSPVILAIFSFVTSLSCRVAVRSGNPMHEYFVMRVTSG